MPDAPDNPVVQVLQMLARNMESVQAQIDAFPLDPNRPYDVGYKAGAMFVLRTYSDMLAQVMADQ